MVVKRGTGAKNKATELHSLIVRSRRACENCGVRCYCPMFPRHTIGCPLQCAHIIPRAGAHTRTRIDNAFCLCASCHSRFGTWPDEWMAFVDRMIGRDKYDELKLDRNEGAGRKFDWDDEVDLLQPIWDAIVEKAKTEA